MPQDNIRVRVKAVGLDKDIANQARLGEKKIRPINLSLNEKGLAQPLGRITGQMGEFEKSMDAAVARVFAFGAAVGVINGVSAALKGMAQSAIEVEKALKDINVIMNMTQTQLENFGSGLFDVAKNTTTSFKDISAAATEFARQGLSAEETLRRIEDAMILTRLSGMDAVDSVSALTAALNGFSSAALTSTDIVNRLANVDAAFAVSSKDLADGLSRAGATAQSAKVNFNELLAAVTSVQQQTARGGAVIGNSFKSIFTRLQRSSVRESLEEIGVATQNAAGEFRSAMAIIQDYASIYDRLSDAQRASTDELIAGVFQVNNFKALIKDLNSEFSIYNQALGTANNTTDEAIKRNEELNKTMSALLTQTGLSIKEMAASIGEITLGPGMEKVLGVIKGFTDGINNVLGEDKGFNIGKTLLKGIGSFVSGPGMILIGGAFIKLFAFIAKQGLGALKSIFAINSETKRQEGLQAAILQILMTEEGVRNKILGGAMSQSQKEKEILGVLKRQTTERIAQDALLKKIAASATLANVAVTPMGAFQPYGRGARGARGKADLGLAKGYIPSYSKEQQSINKGVGGASKSAKPVLVKNFQSSKTKKQDVIANTDEVVVKNFMGSGASAILNQDMMRRFESPQSSEGFDSPASYGSNFAASAGYIPNFAKSKNVNVKAMGSGVLLPQSGKSATGQKFSLNAGDIFSPVPEKLVGRKFNLTGLSVGKLAGKNGSFDEIVDQETKEAFGRIGSKILGGSKSIKPAGPLSDYLDKSAGPQVSGRLFEASLNYIQGAITKNEKGTDRWDFPSLSKRLAVDVFGLKGSTGKKFDAKSSASQSNIGGVAKKIIKDRGGSSYLEKRVSDKKSKSIPRRGRPSNAEGFIPNFKIRDVNDGMRNGLKTRRIEDTESMSAMTYSKPGLNTRNIEWMQSFQKGDAFKLFASAGRSKFMKQGGSYISETLKQQRAFKQGSKTNFEDLVYAYPQLKYRMQDGMVTSGKLIDERNMKQYKFKNLDDLRLQTNSMNRKEFQSILGSNQVSDRFLMSDLKSKSTEAKSDGGVLSLIGKMASGMIPNFALPRNKGMRKFYDFDETLGTYGSNVKSADLFKAHSASWAKPTPLAKELQGKTVSILTARAKQSVPFIEEKLKKWGINPDRILTTADMFNDLKISKDDSGKIIKGKGRVKGFRNLKPAEKKALLLQRMHKKHGGQFNLIDDALENIEAIQKLKNQDITGTHYSFDGQAMGRGSGNAEGYVPNFVNIKAMQELAKRGATKGERASAQNLLNKQQKKIKTIKSKNLYDKMFLESYIQGAGMQGDLDLLSRKGYNTEHIKSLRTLHKKNPQNVRILSNGIVPNYNFVNERMSEASNASQMYNSPVNFNDTSVRDLEVGGKKEKVVVNNKEKFFETGKDVQRAFNLPSAPDGGMVLPPSSSQVGRERSREFNQMANSFAGGRVPFALNSPPQANRGMVPNFSVYRKYSPASGRAKKVGNYSSEEFAKISKALLDFNQMSMGFRKGSITKNLKTESRASGLFKANTKEDKEDFRQFFNSREFRSLSDKLQNRLKNDFPDLSRGYGFNRNPFQVQQLDNVYEGIVPNFAPAAGKSGRQKNKPYQDDPSNIIDLSPFTTFDYSLLFPQRNMGSGTDSTIRGSGPYAKKYQSQFKVGWNKKGISPGLPGSVDDVAKVADAVERDVKTVVYSHAQNFIKSFGESEVRLGSDSAIEKQVHRHFNKGSITAMAGNAFESAANVAFGNITANSGGGDFDVRGPTDQLRKFFNWPPAHGFVGDFKANSESGDIKISMADKILKELDYRGLLSGQVAKEDADFDKYNKDAASKNKQNTIDRFRNVASAATIRGALTKKSKKGEDSNINTERHSSIPISTPTKSGREQEKYFQEEVGFYKGFVPNYSINEKLSSGKSSDALGQAIKRENQAGVPLSEIRVSQSNRLINESNPAGLGVINTFDEPAGIDQGINRAISQGKDPQLHGLAGQGYVPNFVFGRMGKMLGLGGKSSKAAKGIDVPSQGGGGRFASTMMFAPMLLGGFEGTTGEASGYAAEGLQDATQIAAIVSMITDKKKWIGLGAAVGALNGTLGHYSKSLQAHGKILEHNINTNQKIIEGASGVIQAQTRLNEAMNSGDSDKVTRAIELLQDRIRGFPSGDAASDLRDKLVAANGNIKLMGEALEQFQSAELAADGIRKLSVELMKLEEDRGGAIFGFGPSKLPGGFKGEISEEGRAKAKQIGEDSVSKLDLDESGLSALENTIDNEINFLKQSPAEIKAVLRKFGKTLDKESRDVFEGLLDNLPDDLVLDFTKGIQEGAKAEKQAREVADALGEATLALGNLKNSVVVLARATSRSVAELNKNIDKAFALAEKQFESELSILKGLNIITGKQADSERVDFNIAKINSQTAAETEFNVAEFVRVLAKDMNIDSVEGKDGSVFSGSMGDILSNMYDASIPMSGQDPRFLADQIISKISEKEPDSRSKEEQELLDKVVELNQKSSAQIQLLKKQNQIADRQATMASRVALRNSQLNMDREGETFSNFAFASKFEPKTSLDKDIQARSKMDMLNILEPLFGVDEGSRAMRQESGTQQAIGNVQRVLLGMGVESDQGFMSEKNVSISSLIDSMKSALIGGDHSKGQNDMLAYMIRGLEKQQIELAKTAKDPAALQKQTIESTAKDLGINMDDLGIDLDGLGFDSLNAIADELGKEPIELKHLISMDQNIAEMKISLSKFEALPAILSKLEEIKGKDVEKVEARKDHESKVKSDKEKVQSISTRGLSVSATGSTQVNAGSVNLNTNGSRGGSSNAASGFIPNFASEDSLRNKLSGASWSKGNQFTSGVVSGIMSTNSGDSYLENRGFSEYEGKTFTGGAALRVAGFYPGATSAIFREMGSLEKEGVADPLSQIQLTIPKGKSNFSGLKYDGAVVTNKMDEGGVSPSNYISKIRAVHGVTPRDDSFSTTGAESLSKTSSLAFGSMSALKGMSVVPNFSKGKSSVGNFRKTVDELSEAMREIEMNPLKEGAGGQTNKRLDNINSLKKQIIDVLNSDNIKGGRVRSFLGGAGESAVEMNKVLSEKLGIHGLMDFSVDLMAADPVRVSTGSASRQSLKPPGGPKITFGYDALQAVKMGDEGLVSTRNVRTDQVNQGTRGVAHVDMSSPEELIQQEDIGLDKEARDKAEINAKRAVEKKSLGRRLKDKLPKFSIADRLNLRGLENYVPKWATKEGGKQILTDMGERARNFGTGIRERLNISRILEGRAPGNIESAVEAFESDKFLDDVKVDSPPAQGLFDRMSTKVKGFRENQVRKKKAADYIKEKRKRENSAELERLERERDSRISAAKSEKEKSLLDKKNKKRQAAAEKRFKKEQDAANKNFKQGKAEMDKELEKRRVAEIQQAQTDQALDRTRSTGIDGAERVTYNNPVYEKMSLMDDIKARAANFAGFKDTSAQVQMEMNRQYNAQKFNELARGKRSGSSSANEPRTAFDDFKLKAWGAQHAAETTGANASSGVGPKPDGEPVKLNFASTPESISSLQSTRAETVEPTFSDKMQKFLKEKFGKVFAKQEIQNIGDYEIFDGSGRAVGKMQDGSFVDYGTKDEVTLYDHNNKPISAGEVIDVHSSRVDPIALEGGSGEGKGGTLVNTEIKSQAELRELFRAHQAGEIDRAEASRRLSKVMKEDPSLAKKLNLKTSEGVLALEDSNTKSISSRIGRGGEALQNVENLIQNKEFQGQSLDGMSGGQPVEDMLARIDNKKSYPLPPEKLAIDSVKSPSQIKGEGDNLAAKLALQDMRQSSPEFLKRNLGLDDLSDKDLLQQRILQQREMFQDQLTNPNLSKEQAQRVGGLSNNFEANLRFFQDLKNKEKMKREGLHNMELVKRHARDATETLHTAGGRSGISSLDIVNQVMQDPEQFKTAVAAGEIDPKVSQLGDINALFKHMNPEQISTWKKIAQVNVERSMLNENIRGKLPNQLSPEMINKLTNVEKHVGMNIVEPFVDQLALTKKPFTVGGLVKHLDVKHADGSPLKQKLGIDEIVNGIKKGKLISAMARKNNLIPSEKPDARLQIQNILESKIDPISAAKRIREIETQARVFESAELEALNKGSAVVRPEDARAVVSQDGSLDFSNIKASDPEIENARAAMDQITQSGDQKVSENGLAKSLDPAEPASSQKQLILEAFLKKSGILQSGYKTRFSKMLENSMANGGSMTIDEANEMAHMLDVQRNSPNPIFRDDDTKLAQQMVDKHFKERNLRKTAEIGKRVTSSPTPSSTAEPVTEAEQLRSGLREAEGTIADVSLGEESGDGQQLVDDVVEAKKEIDPEFRESIDSSPDTPASQNSKELTKRTRALSDWVVESGLWKGTSKAFKSGFGLLGLKDGVVDLSQSMIDKMRKKNERKALEDQFEDSEAPRKAVQELVANPMRDEALEDSYRRNPKSAFEMDLEQSLAGKEKVGDEYKYTKKGRPKISMKNALRIEANVKEAATFWKNSRRTKGSIAATQDPLDLKTKPDPLDWAKTGDIKETSVFKEMKNNLNWGDRSVNKGESSVSFSAATQEERISAIAEEIQSRVNKSAYYDPEKVSSIQEDFKFQDPDFDINNASSNKEYQRAISEARVDDVDQYLEDFKIAQQGSPEEVDSLVEKKRSDILGTEKTETKITKPEAIKRASQIVDNASTARTIRVQKVLDDAVNLGGGFKGMTATTGINVGAMYLANSETGQNYTDAVANMVGAGSDKFVISNKEGSKFLSPSGNKMQEGQLNEVDVDGIKHKVELAPAFFDTRKEALEFSRRNPAEGFDVVNARDTEGGRSLLRRYGKGFSQDKGILGVDNTELVGTGLGVGLESIVAGGLALKSGAGLGAATIVGAKAGGIALAPALGIYGGEYLRDEFSGYVGEGLGLASYAAGGAIAGAMIGGPKGALVGGLIGAGAYVARVGIGKYVNFDYDQINSDKLRMSPEQLKAKRDSIIEGAEREAEEIRALMEQAHIASQEAQKRQSVDIISGKPFDQGFYEKSVIAENISRAKEKGAIISNYLKYAQKMDERIRDNRDLRQEGEGGGFKHDHTYDTVNGILSETMTLFTGKNWDAKAIKELAEKGQTSEQIFKEINSPEYKISRINRETGKVEEHMPNKKELVDMRANRSKEYLSGLSKINEINRKRGTLQSGSDFMSSNMSVRDVRRLGNMSKPELEGEWDKQNVIDDQTLVPDRRERLFYHKDGKALRDKKSWKNAISRGSLQYGRINYPMEMADTLGIALKDGGKNRKREEIEGDMDLIHDRWSKTGDFKFPEIFSPADTVEHFLADGMKNEAAERFYGIQRDGWDIQQDPNQRSVIMSHPDHGIVEFPYLGNSTDPENSLDKLLERYERDILKSGYEENVGKDTNLRFGYNDRTDYGDSSDGRTRKSKYKTDKELAENLPPERRRMLSALSALMRRGEQNKIAAKFDKDQNEFRNVRVEGTKLKSLGGMEMTQEELFGRKSESFQQQRDNQFEALNMWPDVMGIPDMLQYTASVEAARIKDNSDHSSISARAMLGAVPSKKIKKQHETLGGLLESSGKTMQWWKSTKIGERAKEYNELTYNKDRKSGLQDFINRGDISSKGLRNKLTGELLTSGEKVSGEQRTLDSLRKTVAGKFGMFDISPKDQMLSPEEIALMSAQFDGKNYDLPRVTKDGIQIGGGGSLTAAERKVSGAEAGTEIGPLFKKIFDMNAGEDGMLSRSEIFGDAGGDEGLEKNVSELLRSGYIDKLGMGEAGLELGMLKYFSGNGYPSEFGDLMSSDYLQKDQEQLMEIFGDKSSVDNFIDSTEQASLITKSIPYHQTLIKKGGKLEEETNKNYKGLFEARKNLKPTGEEENAIVMLSERAAQIKAKAGGEETKAYLDIIRQRQTLLNKKKKFQEVDNVINTSISKGLFNDGGPFSLPHFLQKNLKGGAKYSGFSQPNWRPDKIDSNWKNYHQKYFAGSAPAATKLDAMEAALIDSQFSGEDNADEINEVVALQAMDQESAERKKFIEENMNSTAKKILEQELEGGTGNLELFEGDSTPDKPQLTNIFDPLKFIQKYTKDYNVKKGELWRSTDSAKKKFEEVRSGAVVEPGGQTAADQRKIALTRLKDAMNAELKHRRIIKPGSSIQDVLNRSNYPEMSNTDWSLGSTYKDFFNSYDDSTIKVNASDGSNIAVESKEEAGRLIYKDRKDEIDKVLKARGLMTQEGAFVSKVGETPISENKIFELISTTSPGSGYVAKNAAKFDQMQKIWATKYGGNFTRGAMGLFNNEGAKFSLTSSSPIGDLNNTAFAGQAGGGFSVQRAGNEGDNPEILGQFDTLTPQDKLMHAISQSASKGFKGRAGSDDFRSIYKSMSLNERELFKSKYADTIETTVPVGIVQQLNDFISATDKEDLYGAAKGDRIPNYIKLKIKNKKRLTDEDKVKLAEAKKEEANARRIVSQKRRASGISRGASHLIDHSDYNECLARFVSSSPGFGPHRGLSGIDEKIKGLDDVDLQYGPRKFEGRMLKNEADKESMKTQLLRARGIYFDQFKAAAGRDPKNKTMGQDMILFDHVHPRGFRENPDLCNIKTNQSYRAGVVGNGVSRFENTGPFDVSKKAEILESVEDSLRSSTLNDIQKAAIAKTLEVQQSIKDIEQERQRELSDPAVLAEFDLDKDGKLSEDELRLKELKEIAAKNSAAGFKPSQRSGGQSVKKDFKGVASEMFAAKKAGYKTPLRPNEVGLAKLRTSTGRVEKRTVNSREKMFNVGGMDFVAPPRDAGAVARKYSSDVKSEFGFDPYDDSSAAASGFSPTSKGLQVAFDSRGLIKAITSQFAQLGKLSSDRFVDALKNLKPDSEEVKGEDSDLVGAGKTAAEFAILPLRKLLNGFINSKAERSSETKEEDSSIFKPFVDSLKIFKKIINDSGESIKQAFERGSSAAKALNLDDSEEIDEKSLKRNSEKDNLKKLNPMSPAIPILKQLLDCCRKGSQDQKRLDQKEVSEHLPVGVEQSDESESTMTPGQKLVQQVAKEAYEGSTDYEKGNFISSNKMDEAVESIDSGGDEDVESAKKRFLEDDAFRSANDTSVDWDSWAKDKMDHFNEKGIGVDSSNLEQRFGPAPEGTFKRQAIDSQIVDPANDESVDWDAWAKDKMQHFNEKGIDVDSSNLEQRFGPAPEGTLKREAIENQFNQEPSSSPLSNSDCCQSIVSAIQSINLERSPEGIPQDIQKAFVSPSQFLKNEGDNSGLLRSPEEFFKNDLSPSSAGIDTTFLDAIPAALQPLLEGFSAFIGKIGDLGDVLQAPQSEELQAQTGVTPESSNIAFDRSDEPVQGRVLDSIEEISSPRLIVPEGLSEQLQLTAPEEMPSTQVNVDDFNNSISRLEQALSSVSEIQIAAPTREELTLSMPDSADLILQAPEEIPQISMDVGRLNEAIEALNQAVQNASSVTHKFEVGLDTSGTINVVADSNQVRSDLQGTLSNFRRDIESNIETTMGYRIVEAMNSVVNLLSGGAR